MSTVSIMNARRLNRRQPIKKGRRGDPSFVRSRSVSFTRPRTASRARCPPSCPLAPYTPPASAPAGVRSALSTLWLWAICRLISMPLTRLSSLASAGSASKCSRRLGRFGHCRPGQPRFHARFGAVQAGAAERRVALARQLRQLLHQCDLAGSYLRQPVRIRRHQQLPVPVSSVPPALLTRSCSGRGSCRDWSWMFIGCVNGAGRARCRASRPRFFRN